MVALIALAWLALWVWRQSPYGRFLGHHSLEAVGGNAALMLVFVAGWTLMVVAMMLPTSLPLVAALFRTLVRGRPDRARLTALLIAGYLAIRTLFGVLVYCGDWILHGAVERSWRSTLWATGSSTPPPTSRLPPGSCWCGASLGGRALPAPTSCSPAGAQSTWPKGWWTTTCSGSTTSRSE